MRFDRFINPITFDIYTRHSTELVHLSRYSVIEIDLPELIVLKID